VEFSSGITASIEITGKEVEIIEVADIDTIITEADGSRDDQEGRRRSGGNHDLSSELQGGEQEGSSTTSATIFA
jgi:hypothetical protein